MVKPWRPSQVYPRPTGEIRRADGDRVICELCGADFHGLQAHVWRSHGLTGDEYRVQFGIAKSDRLLSVSALARYQAAAKRRHKANPRHIDDIRKIAHSPEARARARDVAREHLEQGLSRSHGNPAVERKCPECGAAYLTFSSEGATTCPRPACVYETKRRVALANRQLSVALYASNPEAVRKRAARLQSYAAERGPKQRKPHPCSAPECEVIIPTSFPKTCSPECRRIVRQETIRKVHQARQGDSASMKGDQ